jgi:hypothetical protein
MWAWLREHKFVLPTLLIAAALVILALHPTDLWSYITLALAVGISWRLLR